MNRKVVKYCLRGITVCTLLGYVLTGGAGSSGIAYVKADVYPSSKIETSPATPTIEKILSKSAYKNDYLTYSQKYKDIPSPKENIRIHAEDAQLIAGEANLIAGGDGGSNSEGKVWEFSSEGTLEWKIPLTQEGMYKIAFNYCTKGDDARNINASLCINGQFPFDSAKAFEFPRLWKQEPVLETDINGNDIRPKQTSLNKWTSLVLYDREGLANEQQFYLKQGINTITLHIQNSGIAIGSLRLFNEEPMENYSSYIKSVDQSKPNVSPIFIQAENLLYKNDPSIMIGADRTGPSTIPSHPVKLKLNIINGASYKLPGQKTVWEFSVPQDGLYKLGIRFKQDDLQGLFVTRKICIDDQLLFKELEDIRFYYSDEWKYSEVGDKEPYGVYLKAGTHTLSMEVTTGEMSSIIATLQDSVYILNYILRKIIMVTGATPDIYRDYSLHKEIPELLPALQEMSQQLYGVAEKINVLSNHTGGHASVLKQTAYQLETFVENPDSITERLESFKSNISAVSSLMLLIQQQPLDIDYITVSSLESKVKGTKASWFTSLLYQIRGFIGSFYNDYSSIAKNTGNVAKTIKVWYGGGREQAEIIRKMIDDDFTPNKGIGVDLELVQIPLSQAVLAGTAPDLVMNVSRNQPINLAARGALVPLSELDGFDELAKNFLPTSFTPYSFNEKIYAIPVQLDFHVMFTRDDILDELGMKAPQTWDEFYEILPVIQRQNMTIGLPYTAMSSQATIESGIGAKDIFPAFVFQRGGKIYSEGLDKTALDSPICMDAFEEWTNLYTKYGLPLQYDFYNRFRTGEIPIGIQGYGMYNLLEAAAPEIKGMWSMQMIPGTRKPDGTIDRSESASGSGAVLLKDSKEHEAAWEFMKWWCSTSVQARYGTEVETLMGTAARYNPANINAVELLLWKTQELDILKAQQKYIVEIPEVPGGYYTSRNLDNAFRNVVFSQENYREALIEQNVATNSEIHRKRKEFGLE